MEDDFSDLDPEIEAIHYGKFYDALSNKMYSDKHFSVTLNLHRIGITNILQRDNDLVTAEKQIALAQLKAIHAIEKEYQLLKVIDQ